MFRPRVIPCLLLQGEGLVKTVKFRSPKYVGDPINAVRIFNDKEVDELALLDISATRNGTEPQFTRIADIASECFMPLAYGGGVRSLHQVERLLKLGLEKIVVNSVAFSNPDLVRQAAKAFGSQSILVSMDVKRGLLGRCLVYVNGGAVNTGLDPVSYARRAEDLGAGELFVTSIDRDGTMMGYDLELVSRVANCVQIPVIACGGAGSLSDLVAVIKEGGASAASAGSLFVFHGKYRAVLISYPTPCELDGVLA